MKRGARNHLTVASAAFIMIVVVLGLSADMLPLNDPYVVDMSARLSGPGPRFPLGSDHLGRCNLSRLIYGIRPTVFLSLGAMAATLAIGSALGVVSGFYRGVIDEMVMRVCDVMLSFPSQVMILAVVGMLGPGIGNVVLANVMVKWAWYARMIRGSTIKRRESLYVRFSEASGSGSGFIMARHLIPDLAAELAVLASLETGWVILNISMLSFLGLGIQAPKAEWGAMLSEAKTVMFRAPAQMLVPGIAIMVVVAAFNFIGDGLRDYLDPNAGRGGRE